MIGWSRSSRPIAPLVSSPSNRPNPNSRPHWPQTIHKLARLENLNRGAVGPIHQELPSIGHGLGVILEITRFLKRIAIGLVNSKDERTHAA